MSNELIEALVQIEKEKGISKDVMIKTIESALISAYKKNFGATHNVRVTIDPDTGAFKVMSLKQVIEDGEENEGHQNIYLSDAKEIDPNFKVGDIVEEEVTPKDFGRIAAQTAKNNVVQKMREAERSMIFDEFMGRETELINGIIHRCSSDTVFVNLGSTEAVMMPSEQLTSEDYQPGQRIKAVITEVRKTSKGPQILISRTNAGLVKRLFEAEVPEIADGYVEVKSVAREAGSRTKIAVHGTEPDIDPVGACVGPKGVRVQNVVNELYGEKIDIIKWSEDPGEYISNSLSPSNVEYVIIKEDEKSALVVVPDYQLSLAIGKEGQNARLAARLTGWKIDIKSLSQYQEVAEDYGDIIEKVEYYDENGEYDEQSTEWSESNEG